MTTILIVEDEESLADPLAFLLRKEGFEPIIAHDGPTALEKFAANDIDIVLLDLMLPGMSGTEVCKQLRTTSSVPVIMVTARDSEIDKVVGLELGADDYVTKPYSSRELIARIRAVLRRGHDSGAGAEAEAEEAADLLESGDAAAAQRGQPARISSATSSATSSIALAPRRVVSALTKRSTWWPAPFGWRIRPTNRGSMPTLSTGVGTSPVCSSRCTREGAATQA